MLGNACSKHHEESCRAFCNPVLAGDAHPTSTQDVSVQYEQQKFPHLGQAGAQRESWGDTGALHDPLWGFGCSPSGWHQGGAPNPKLGRGKGTDFSLCEKCPRVSSPTGYCYTRNRAPQRLHSFFFFPFFFPFQLSIATLSELLKSLSLMSHVWPKSLRPQQQQPGIFAHTPHNGRKRV